MERERERVDHEEAYALDHKGEGKGERADVPLKKKDDDGIFVYVNQSKWTTHTHGRIVRASSRSID